MSSWWMSDNYDGEFPLPKEFYDLAGPKGPALVSVNSNGSTQEGWGLLGKVHPKTGERAEGFMPRYTRNEFGSRPKVKRAELRGDPFAIVMRSVQMICVDIDGKNGGFEHAKELGLTIPTLAETSKSGNGYHLYYRTDEEWAESDGFAQFSDAIGIVQGVDIRATGCVYHYETQRWGSHNLAPLPPYLASKLATKEHRRNTTRAAMAAITEMDDWEKTMKHDELLTELKKPIPAGKRNNTLFAIGSKLMLAEVPDWEQAVEDRATQVGLDSQEIDKLISNISAYGAAA